MFWNKYKKTTDDFLSYLKIEQKDGETEMVADIKDEDIKRWLYGVTTTIQKAMSRHKVIENYLAGWMQVGGQTIEFALVKDNKSGPHAMSLKLKEENRLLKERIKELESKNL